MDAAVPSKVGLLLLLLSSSPLLECSRSWSSSSSSTSFACLVVTLRVGRLFISSTGFMDRKAPVFLRCSRKQSASEKVNVVQLWQPRQSSTSRQARAASCKTHKRLATSYITFYLPSVFAEERFWSVKQQGMAKKRGAQIGLEGRQEANTFFLPTPPRRPSSYFVLSNFMRSWQRS